MSTSYFGRAWKVKVTPQATGEEITLSNSEWEKDGKTQAARCTFDIEQHAVTVAYWFADIAVYNCLPGMNQVLKKGDPVTVEAGYDDPGSGLIFKGTIWQPIWERENETDFKLTLHCFVRLYEEQNTYVTLPALGSAQNPISQAAAVRKVADAVGLNVAYLDPSLETKLLPRGEAYSGRAINYFLGVAIDNHLDCWISWDGLYIRSLAPQETAPATQGQTIGGIALPGAQAFQGPKSTPDVIYAPPYAPTSQTDSTLGITKYTLIGTPQQTEQGANFRVLLDPGLGLGTLAKIDQALLHQIRQIPGQFPIIYNDLPLIVAGIRHRGDTRGNEWYTEVIGITPNWPKLFAKRSF